MEDIYSNLDNYNEQAIIGELQNENKELKFQLEELTSRLETLQKTILQDFDHLSSEHKKLESNYSSLLKTAKAEVERKTKAIALLNQEKDKLVLQTLQNRNRSNFPKDGLPGNGKNHSKWKNSSQTVRKNFDTERCDSRISPKEDIQINTDNSTKENFGQKKPYNEVNKPRFIQNRRKSMPAMDMPAPKFSSDEEDIPSVEEHFIPREYPDRHIDRHIRPGKRSSDCSCLEERNSYNYGLPKEPPINRNHRNMDIEKAQPHDRDDSQRHNNRDDSQRHNRDRSPGRKRRWHRDDYHDKRSDYDRHRRLESPPNDNYNQYTQRHHYDKQRYQDRDRYNSRGHERKPTKHKVPEYDEPRSKKMKSNTYQRQYEDEKRHERHQTVGDYDRHFTSCQSPDINMETNPNHEITEIKLSATTKLDDPRKSSERYIKDTKKGKETLIAVRGMNVDISRLPLENTAYEVEYVMVPDALKEKPASMNVMLPEALKEKHSTDGLVNEIYSNIDNPVLDASMESGELPDDPEDKILIKQNSPYNEKDQSISNKRSNTIDNINTNPKPNISTYKIPKIKSCSSISSIKNKVENIDSPVRKTSDSKSKVNKIESKNDNSQNKKEPINEPVDKEIKKDITDLKEAPAVISKPPHIPTLNTNIESNYEHEKKKQYQKIVEDDLELSDETCDYTETQKTQDTVPNVLDNKTVMETKCPAVVETPAKTEPTDTFKEKSPDRDKKVNTKRRHSKPKTLPEQTKPEKSIEKPSKKKVKEKKDVKNKEIKHKFSELFGDSSSLILPEDLGLPAVPPTFSQPADLYVPIFEDAQDAIDINVNKEPPIDLNKIPTNQEVDSKAAEVDISTENKENPIQADEMLPVKTIYQNMEVGDKPKEDAVKTLVISSGVQQNVAINDNIPPVEVIKPININLKALATSTPHKLASHDPPDISQKTPETNGHTTQTNEVNTDNLAVDNSLSNVDSKSNDTDVPDVRIVVKRRRKVVKKP